ncbi:MAG: histidinol-phosphatase [Verrucomicrobiales bacterium]|jgi:histidinol-phosphatase
MPSESLPDLLDFARQIAFEAGRLTLGYFQTGVKPDFKADDTPVTIADKKAEELIRKQIETAYPHHGILGEEFGEVREGTSHRWIIDPIDGTKSFMCGVPIYGTLVGLEIDGKPEAGVAYFPGLDEMISAGTGLGCSLNGRACRVSDQTDLSRAIMSHADTAAYAKAGKTNRWDRLQNSVYYNAGWCDAYGYLLVASGRIEIMSDPVMNIWDCAPFVPILREAGGYFGDWAGNEGIDFGESLGTSQQLLGAVLEAIGEE